ncbi:DUF3085 domain-containing protein [Streptomyces sp. NBC_01433]|uniref:hypothetical protein n=1 Tax=Streptomyces sp. NBC_01433 TaxID=2903864 RepID=UPI0022549105|nr:hypothetical protein [Streptomyces sp. NBC_01433]MCX4681358.1 DUF3085 domain-containing protein [Streptomyces sp. NBC_01433]MCX4681704.1 DUF3085 domain-containing protein [Streptomyces sp. NBC_01433]MCX4682434.1 DUF3085 domain-containing protein [Streptomyces sp. NBC_01433]
MNQHTPTTEADPQPGTPEYFDALLREVLGDAYRPTAKQDCTLTFPLDQVLSAAEHAIAAPKHALGPGDTDAHPRLWWIKGDGTFLMSNGIDNTPNARDEKGHWRHIAFADTWGPGSDPSTVLGGDDLHETLDLTTTPGDGPALIDMLRTATADNATHFLLHIAYDDEGMQLTMTTK